MSRHQQTQVSVLHPMDDKLKQLAESRYSQKEFLGILFELAVEDQWFDLQHMIQHDMAKAILADYSFELGEGYLNTDIFFRHWEEVIEVGWSAFCQHTGLPREKVNLRLQELRDL